MLIFIQTNLNSYKNIGKSIEILNFYNDSTNIINTDYIYDIIDKITSLTEMYSSNNFWNNILTFLKEDNDVELPSVNDQIINSINHIIGPLYPKVLEKIENYKLYGLNNKQYIKNYWFSYKPNPNNNNIININNLINKLDKRTLLKNNNTYSLENISLLREISTFDVPLYDILNIDVVDILNNKSFIQLYKYVILQYGNQNKSLYLNLLINRFINTINNTQINNIFHQMDGM